MSKTYIKFSIEKWPVFYVALTEQLESVLISKWQRKCNVGKIHKDHCQHGINHGQGRRLQALKHGCKYHVSNLEKNSDLQVFYVAGNALIMFIRTHTDSSTTTVYFIKKKT